MQNGPMLVCGKTESGNIVLVGHHPVVDTVSWQIIERAFAATDSSPCQPLASWSRVVSDVAIGSHERKFWDAAIAHADAPEISSVVGERTVKVLTRVVSADIVQVLQQSVAPAFRTQLGSVLLAAVGASLSSESACIDVEGHGREETLHGDVSSIVGWLTTMYPVWFPTTSIVDAIKGTKEALEAIRLDFSGGVAFGTTYGGKARSKIGFNFLGRLRAEHSAADGLVEDETVNVFHHDVEFTMFISSTNQLILQTAFDPNHMPTIHASRLSSNIVDALASAARLQPNVRDTLSPSDFDARGLVDQQSLDSVLNCCPATAIETILPLTPMQQGMLFHAMSDSVSYTTQHVLHFGQRPDLQALQCAWSDVMTRFQALRIWVPFPTGEVPIQVVLKRADAAIRVVKSTTANFDADLSEAANNEKRSLACNLDAFPLMRLCAVIMRRLSELC